MYSSFFFLWFFFILSNPRPRVFRLDQFTGSFQRGGIRLHTPHLHLTDTALNTAPLKQDSRPETLTLGSVLVQLCRRQVSSLWRRAFR